MGKVSVLAVAFSCLASLANAQENCDQFNGDSQLSKRLECMQRNIAALYGNLQITYEEASPSKRTFCLFSAPPNTTVAGAIDCRLPEGNPVAIWKLCSVCQFYSRIAVTVGMSHSLQLRQEPRINVALDAVLSRRY